MIFITLDITAGSWELLTAVAGLVVCHPDVGVGQNHLNGVFAGDDCLFQGFELPT